MRILLEGHILRRCGLLCMLRLKGNTQFRALSSAAGGNGVVHAASFCGTKIQTGDLNRGRGCHRFSNQRIRIVRPQINFHCIPNRHML